MDAVVFRECRAWRKAFRAALTAAKKNTIGLPKLSDEAEPGVKCGAEEFCRQTFIEVFLLLLLERLEKAVPSSPALPEETAWFTVLNGKFQTSNFPNTFRKRAN